MRHQSDAACVTEGGCPHTEYPQGKRVKVIEAIRPKQIPPAGMKPAEFQRFSRAEATV
jgi:hypothetical protein